MIKNSFLYNFVKDGKSKRHFFFQNIVCKVVCRLVNVTGPYLLRMGSLNKMKYTLSILNIYMKYTMLCILSVYLRYTFSIHLMYTFCSSNLEQQKLYKKYTSLNQCILKVYTFVCRIFH